MARDPRLDKLQRLRTERVTRASGSYYGTRATAYGNVQAGPRRRDGGRTLLSIVLFAVVAAVVLSVIAQYALHGSRSTPVAHTRNVTVTVAPGESRADLASALQRAGLVPNATIFSAYLRVTGDQIIAGPHALNTGMSMDEVAHNLGTTPPAAPVAYITIHPGRRAEQIAEALDGAGVASYQSMMDEVRHGVFPISQYPFLADKPAGKGLEGYLLPDGYQFRKGGGAHYAIGQILANFGAKVAPATVAQGKRVYGSFYNAVIVASMIERESGTNHDRALIASVILNRLNDHTDTKFTRLNIDATIQYAVNHAPNWWQSIRQGQIARSQNNPYNTYYHDGLPPSPISEARATTIDAIVHPASTPYFYYSFDGRTDKKSSFCTAAQWQAQGNQCNAAPQ